MRCFEEGMPEGCGVRVGCWNGMESTQPVTEGGGLGRGGMGWLRLGSLYLFWDREGGGRAQGMDLESCEYQTR